MFRILSLLNVLVVMKPRNSCKRVISIKQKLFRSLEGLISLNQLYLFHLNLDEMWIKRKLTLTAVIKKTRTFKLCLIYQFLNIIFFNKTDWSFTFSLKNINLTFSTNIVILFWFFLCLVFGTSEQVSVIFSHHLFNRKLLSKYYEDYSNAYLLLFDFVYWCKWKLVRYLCFII